MKTKLFNLSKRTLILFIMIFFVSFIPVHAETEQINIEESEILEGEEDEYNDYADTTLEGVSSRGTHVVGNVVKNIGDSISNQFAPGLKNFLAQFGYNFDGNVLIFNYMSKTVESKNPVLNMNQIFGVIAYALATLLFFIEIYKSVFTTVFGKAQSPIQVLVRYGITVLLITVSQQLIAPIIDLFTYFWDMTTTYTVIDEVDLAGGATLGAAGIGGILVSVFLAPAFAGISLITCIIFLVLLWILVREVIKLIVEMLERYIVSCFLILFAPIGFSFLTSPTTERVFTSYITMFISQLFLLIINNLWLYSMLYLMVNIGFSVTAYIFVLAWVKTGQKVDELLQSLGLSVAKTGGDLFDSLGSMVYAAQNMFGSRSLIGQAGQAMTNSGLKNGNPQLAAAGSTLSNLLNPAGRKTASDMQDIITKRGGSAADNAGVLQSKADDFSKGHVDATIMDQFNNRGRANEYMTSAFGSNWQETIAGKGGSVDVSSMSVNNAGMVQGTMKDKDGNASSFTMAAGGKNLQNASTLGAALSGDSAKTAAATGWKVQYGKDGGMNSLQNGAVYNGTTGYSNFANQIGTDTAALQKMTGVKPSDISQISVSGGNAVMHGKNGEVLGAVRNNGGGKAIFADAQSAPQFAPKNVSSPMAADNTAQLRSDNSGTTHEAGTVMYPNPDGPQVSDFFEKHKGEAYSGREISEGVENGTWLELGDNVAYNTQNGRIYMGSYDGGDFSDGLYVAAPESLNPSGYMEEYDDQQMAEALMNGEDYERTFVAKGISDEAFDSIIQDAVDHNVARDEYNKNYDQSLADAAVNETDYLSNRIADQENLWRNEIDDNGNVVRNNSIEMVDTEKHIFVTEDRGLGKQVFEYKVIVDDSVPKGWKVAGGGKGHNLIAYRRQTGKGDRG